MYYGNASVGSQQDPANVWDANFAGVWHLGESSGAAQDSTSYGTNGTVSGTFTRQASGQVGYAYDFNTNGEVDVGDPADGHLDFGTGSYTVSAWMNVDQSTGTWQRFLYKGGTSSTTTGYVFETTQTASDMSAGISDGTNNLYSGASISLDTWTHIVQVVDRSAQELRIYKNGAEQGTATNISTIGSVSNSRSLQFPHAGSYDADGLLDEVRISNTARSADWIATEFSNQDDPANFLSVCGKETAPAPTVTNVAPASGSTAGGTAVTITGTDFVSGATVTFGGTAATGVTVVNATTITATTPVHAAGAVDVTVTNPDTKSGTFIDGYTYVPPPTVTSVAPASGPDTGGTSVTITGTGFDSGVTNVTFGGTAATGVTFVNATTITATTPAHAAGAVDVVVTNPDTQSGTLTNGYTYTGSCAAFPTVVGTSTSEETDTSTPTITLPASIAAGDLIIAFLAQDNNAHRLICTSAT
jgi:hypothetical protein